MAPKVRFVELFHPVAFLISIGVGFLGVYLLAPEPTVIVRYPTPQNAGKELYRDKVGSCYRYKSEEVACPADPRQVQRVRLQG